MQTEHSKTIRGLSIATIAVAGLCVLACVIGFIALGVGGAALSSVTPDMLGYSDHGHVYDYGYGYSYSYDYLDDEDAFVLLSLVFGLGGVALFFELVAAAVALVAGIFGLRFFDKPEKMNLLFGWSLAGAIVSFLGGNIVTMVLLIIVCVFAHKDKQQAATQPVVAAANVTTYTAPAAPVAPAAPAAQPTQPVAADPVASQPVATQPVAVQPAATQPTAAQPASTDTAAPTATQPVAPEEPKAE